MQWASAREMDRIVVGKPTHLLPDVSCERLERKFPQTLQREETWLARGPLQPGPSGLLQTRVCVQQAGSMDISTPFALRALGFSQ